MAAFLALQLLVSNYRNGHIQLSLDNKTAVAYSNHQGGTKSVQVSVQDTEMWCWCLERNILLSAVHIPGLKNFFADPLSRLKKSFNRMDAESSSFSSNCGHLWPTRYGSFRFCSKSPGKEICVLDRRPKGKGQRRIFSKLGGGGGGRDQLMHAFSPSIWSRNVCKRW